MMNNDYKHLYLIYRYLYLRSCAINDIFSRHYLTLKEMDIMDELEPEVKALSQYNSVDKLLESITK